MKKQLLPYQPGKSVIKSINKFVKTNQEIADKYNAKVSIVFEGKETVIAEPKKKEYPHWVCDGCGVRANRLTQQKKLGADFDALKFKRKFDYSTYHKGVCEVCGEETAVTEARDFFYPDFTLLKKGIHDN